MIQSLECIHYHENFFVEEVVPEEGNETVSYLMRQSVILHPLISTKRKKQISTRTKITNEKESNTLINKPCKTKIRL